MFLVLHKHETTSKAECNKTWKQGMANTKASQIDDYSTSAKNDACFFFHHRHVIDRQLMETITRVLLFSKICMKKWIFT